MMVVLQIHHQNPPGSNHSIQICRIPRVHTWRPLSLAELTVHSTSQCLLLHPARRGIRFHDCFQRSSFVLHGLSFCTISLV
uniref:Uncharacterized protein n=1 Tax=Arundo donax TaxID=35708 RepID=A0A0A9DTC4_ARUDO